MPDYERISVTVPPEQVKQIDKAIESGKYASKSDYIRMALRSMEQSEVKEQERTAVLKGIQSMLDGNVVSEQDVFDSLKKKIKAVKQK